MKRHGLVILFAALVGLMGCAVTPEVYRDARLMPAKVALQIVARHTNMEWARNPYAKAYLANHPFCNDQTDHPLPYKSMGVGWDPRSVYVVGLVEVGFWCGSFLRKAIWISDGVEKDDLIDALISLGAKVEINKQ
jgi:hypothetical protein